MRARLLKMRFLDDNFSSPLCCYKKYVLQQRRIHILILGIKGLMNCTAVSQITTMFSPSNCLETQTLVVSLLKETLCDRGQVKPWPSLSCSK